MEIYFFYFIKGIIVTVELVHQEVSTQSSIFSSEVPVLI